MLTDSSSPAFKVGCNSNFGKCQLPKLPIAKTPMKDDRSVYDALGVIPSNPAYSEWLRISSGTFDALPKEEAIAALNYWSPEQKPGEYERLYKNRLKQVKAGSLFHIAGQYGYKSKRGSRGSRDDLSQSMRKATVEAPEPPTMPVLDKGSINELHALQRLRGFEMFAGLQILINREQLGFTHLWDNGEQVRSWIIYDSAKRNAQARRLDGKPWQCIDAKARTLKGFDPKWPIGASRINDNTKTVLFVEGGPDLLTAATWSAYDYAKPCEAVCMTGAGISICPDALPRFEDKQVYIFVHNDTAGFKGALQWGEQLTETGAKVAFRHSEIEGRDFNDALIAGEIINI